MACGSMVREKDSAFTQHKLKQNTRDCGNKISSMARGARSGPTARHLTENMKWAKRKAEVYLNGEMVVCMLACFRTISYTERVSTNGPMVENIKDSGKKISFGAKVPSVGETAGGIEVNTKKT